VVVSSRQEVFQSDFIGAADHAVRLDAPQFGYLNFHRFAFTVPDDFGTWLSDGNHLSGLQVGSAADNLNRLAFTDVSHDDPQAVGLGVGADGENPAGDDVLEGVAQVFTALDLNRAHGQVIGKLLNGQVFW